MEKLHKKCIGIDQMLRMSVCGVAYPEFVPEFGNSTWMIQVGGYNGWKMPTYGFLGSPITNSLLD